MKDKIQKCLSQYPKGLKASQLAKLLDTDKKNVNAYLYSLEGSKHFTIDSNYVWHEKRQFLAQYDSPIVSINRDSQVSLSLKALSQMGRIPCHLDNIKDSKFDCRDLNYLLHMQERYGPTEDFKLLYEHVRQKLIRWGRPADHRAVYQAIRAEVESIYARSSITEKEHFSTDACLKQLIKKYKD